MPATRSKRAEPSGRATVAIAVLFALGLVVGAGPAFADVPLSPGAVTTVAGNGTAATLDGVGTAASLNGSGGVVMVGGGIFVATRDSIRRVDTATLAVTTLAGGGGAGCGVDSSAPGSVTFGSSSSIVSDGTSLYTVLSCGSGSWAVRATSLSTGATSTVGSFSAPVTAGVSLSSLALVSGQLYVAVGAQVVKFSISTGTSSMYVTESGGYGFSALTSDGSSLWAVAADGSGLSHLDAIDLSTGTLRAVGSPVHYDGGGPGGTSISNASAAYLFVGFGNSIRRYAKADATFVEVAGSGVFDQGFLDGTGTDAWFMGASAMVYDGSSLWVSDATRVRKVSTGTALPSAQPSAATTTLNLASAQVQTLSRINTGLNVNGTLPAAGFSGGYGMAVVNRVLYVATYDGLQTVNLDTNVVATFLPGAPSNSCGVNGTSAATSSLRYPTSMTTDGYYLYVGDQCGAIRRISVLTGATSTVVAGAGSLLSGVIAGSLTMGHDGYLYQAGWSIGASYDPTIYRINPRTGTTLAFATIPNVRRLGAVTSDATTLWVTVQQPCTGSGSCPQMNRIDKVDLISGAVSTFIADTGADGRSLAPGLNTLVSAGPYLYADDGSSLLLYVKATPAIGLEIAGRWTVTARGNEPLQDGYATSAVVDMPTAMTSDGRSLFFMDVRSLRIASPAPNPLPAGATDPNGTRGGGNPDAPCDCTNQVPVGAPVNTATGEEWDTSTDVTLPGRFAVPWTRTYSSLKAAEDSPMGYGWSGSFIESLTDGATANDPVKITTETGALTSFAPTSTNAAFQAEPRIHAALRKDPVAGTWTYTRRGTLAAVFRSDGRLVTKTDRNGETVTLGYNTASPPQLTSITTADGRALTIGYNAAHRIATITGPSATGTPARLTQYGYDGNGNLTTVTDSRGKIWTYGYDANHRLTSITAPDTGVTTTHYDATGKVDWQRDPRSKTTTFSYTDSTVGTDQHRTTRVTDATGVATDYEYVNSWLASKTLGAGGTAPSKWIYTHDFMGNQTSLTDPTGVVTASDTYDGAGNKLTETVPAGFAYPDGTVPGTRTTTWTYNEFNKPLTQADSVGGGTTWTYDTHGNVLTEVRKLDNVDSATTQWTRTNSAHPGDVASITDPRNFITSFAYTAEGFAASVTTPAGAITDTSDTTVSTKMTYNPYGDVLTKIEPRGNITGGVPANYTWKSTFDNGGLLLTSKTPLGLITTYGYDGVGRRVTVKNNALKTWTTVYLLDGNVDTVTDPLTHVTSRYLYDDAGRPTSVTDATARTSTTTYDDHGRVATTTRPAGNVAGVSPANKAANTTTYLYDLAGRLASSSTPDPTGGAALTTTTTYDSAGRVWKSTDPANETITTRYESYNNISQITDATGAATQFNYDYASRQTSVYDARGNGTGSTYDKAGNVIKIVESPATLTSPNGRTTTQTWDAAGHLATVTDPRGNANGAVAANFTTSYTYDAAGNLRITTDNLAHTTKTTYDRDGRVATHINPKNRTTSNAYDTTGRLSTISAPDTGITTFGYDIANRRTSVTAPMGGIWVSGYDDAGRIQSETDPAGISRSYLYSSNGELTTVTTPRGTATRSVNALGQLTGIGYSDTTPSVTYTYDRASRRASMTDAAGTVAYNYDADSRPLSITRTQVTGPATSWGYTYDPNGNVLTRTRPDTSVETWVYDAANRATQVSDPTGTTTWSYDDANNPLTTTMPNGTTENKVWDRAGALSSITTKAGSTVRTSQTVTRDTANQPTKTVVVRNAATETRSFLYDLNERVTDVCYTAACTTATATQHWSYDKNGNRLTEQNGVTPGVVTTNTYDTSDRIATSKIGTGATLVPTYDADGNLINDANGHTATFRLDGLTATATTGGATSSYTYDGDGTRLAAITSGTGATSNYIWDPNQGLSTLAQVISDPDGGGVLPATTTVNRFDPSAAPLSVTAAGSTSFVAHDSLGSVTDLTNSAGVIARSADFTPYGAGRSAVGAPATPSGPTSVLGYIGALTDASGQLYLHARQYDPASGSFTTRDPAGYAGSAGYGNWYGTPYGYVAGRVLSQIDPTGRNAWDAIVGIGAAVRDYTPIAIVYQTILVARDPQGAALKEATAWNSMSHFDYVNSKFNPMVGVMSNFDRFAHACNDYERWNALTAVLYGSGDTIAMAYGGAKGLKAGPAAAADAAAGEGTPSPITIAGAETADAVTPGVIRAGDLNLPGVPTGAVGTVTKNGEGLVYQIPRGTPELNSRVASIRVANPVTSGKYQYPNGYVSYLNEAGQVINPLTGETLQPSDPLWHIPLS